MSSLRRILFRLMSVFRSGRAEADLSREIKAHLQLLEDQHVARGMSREEARFAARRAFGGRVEQVKEQQRDARAFRWMTEWWLDLKLGARMMLKYPGLTVIGVFALAVAIGGGAAYHEFVTDLISPRLPLPDGDRFVRIQNIDQNTGEPDRHLAADFQEWKGGLTSVEHLGASLTFDRNLITDDGRAEMTRGVEISASAFQLVPASPALGRPLIAEDEQLTAPNVAVLGYVLWQSRFGGDPGIVGRTIRLGADTHTVVGIMPEGFAFPVNHQLWVPFRTRATGIRRGDGPLISVFGRLKRDVTIDAAQAELDGVALQLAAANPDSTRRLRSQIGPYLGMQRTGEDRLQAIVLYAANLFFVGLLLVCGANVATLVFARTATREGEITVRTALGASRTRIVAQLFAEALVLSLTGAGFGLVVARYGSEWGKEAFRIGAGDGAPAPFWWNDSLSIETWIYAGVLAVIAAALIGVVPALKATGSQMQARLSQASSRGSGIRFGGVWTGVIVAQISFTVLFLMIAVVIRSEAYASQVEMKDAGFPRAQYLSARLSLDGAATATDAAVADRSLETRFTATYDELERRLSAEPGVRQVTYASVFPGRGFAGFSIEFRDTPPPVTTEVEVRRASVASDFFDAFSTPLLAGRRFTQIDVDLNRPIAVVDQTFVDHVMGGRNPVGAYVRQRQNEANPQPGPWLEIVGVVGTLQSWPATPEYAVLYQPVRAARVEPMRMFVHVPGDASAFAPHLRRIAAETDPTLQLSDFRRLDKVDEADQFALAFFLRVVTIVTVVALLLAAAGVYALMSFTVARRTREIGIRIAVGADARRILTGIFSRAFVQVAIGIAVGCVPGIAMLWLNRPESFGLSGRLVATLAALGVTAFIFGVTALACWIPARRALSIHPTDALRADG